eukprot:1436762-Pleurochrysis_carterae.AAC.1
MSPTDATRCMHRRLHAGAARLRSLPSITADALASLAHGRSDGCDACVEANATRQSLHVRHVFGAANPMADACSR